MVKEAEKVAKKKHMTRSEFMRAALRHFIEEMQFDEAVRIADEELKTGKYKVLPPGGLAALIQR